MWQILEPQSEERTGPRRHMGATARMVAITSQRSDSLEAPLRPRLKTGDEVVPPAQNYREC